MDDGLVVFTGIGVVNAAGTNTKAFWDRVTNGQSSIRPIRRFDTADLPVKIAGEIDEFRPSDFVPRRMIIKTDRFTHYALAATEMALADANLELAGVELERVGVWVGNDTGGWDLAERGFLELHCEGAGMVNPWGATAWFPAAPQGFISIRHNIIGYSKSFVCDRASGGAALYFALRAIQRGYNEIALVGGTEAPLTPLGVAAYYASGELSRATDPDGAYRPFDQRRDGLVLGEGSTILVLESAAHALSRGASAKGVFLSACMTFDPDPNDSTGLERAMSGAIRDAGLTPNDVDVVFAEGCATVAADRVEAAALSRVFDKQTARVRVTCTKSNYGHLFGASTATEVACGLMSIATGALPPIVNLTYPEAKHLRFVIRPERAQVSNFLVTSRSREGGNVALVIGNSRALEQGNAFGLTV
jgi:3-oxoacyl-(acyl-carrier-protein) synthase